MGFYIESSEDEDDDRSSDFETQDSSGDKSNIPESSPNKFDCNSLRWVNWVKKKSKIRKDKSCTDIHYHEESKEKCFKSLKEIEKHCK